MRPLPLVAALAIAVVAALVGAAPGRAQVPTLITIDVPLNATGIHPNMPILRVVCEARSSSQVVARATHDITVPESRSVVETVSIPLERVGTADPATATSYNCRVWLCTSSTSCAPSSNGGNVALQFREGTSTITVQGVQTAGVEGPLSF